MTEVTRRRSTFDRSGSARWSEYAEAERESESKLENDKTHVFSDLVSESAHEFSPTRQCTVSRAEQ